MCQDVKVTAGAALVSSLLTRAGAVFVMAAGAATAMFVLAQGSAAVAWVVVGLTAWAAFATIGWIAAAASSKRKVVVAARGPVRRSAPAVAVGRVAVEAAVEDPAASAEVVGFPACEAAQRAVQDRL